MEQALKQRLVGATVLIALGVIFLPAIINGPPKAPESDRRQHAPVPAPPPSQMNTRRLPVIADGALVDPGAAGSDETARSSISAVPGDERQPPVSLPAEPAPTVPQPAMAEPDTAEQAAESALDESMDESRDPMQEPAGSAGEAPATATESEAPGDALLTEDVIADDRWRVQVASLGNPDNVRRLQHRLQELELAYATERITSRDVALYRVTAGPFTDRAGAERARKRIVAADSRLQPRVLEPESQRRSEAGEDEDDGRQVAADALAGLDRYAVQTGVFSTRERAQELVQQLQEAGFAAYYETLESGSEQMFRVRIGPLLSARDAQHILDRIQEDMGIEALVVDY